VRLAVWGEAGDVQRALERRHDAAAVDADGRADGDEDDGLAEAAAALGLRLVD
jgi:tellurite resistance protein